MSVRLLAVITAVCLLELSAPAIAEDPPPFAFQWTLDFPPGQMSIDPAGNIWFLNATTHEIHRARRDGNPLDAGGGAMDLACDATAGAYILDCDPEEGGARRIHADGLTACNVFVPCEGKSVVANDKDEAFLALGDYLMILNPAVVKVSPDCGTEMLFQLSFVPGDMALATDGSFFIIDPSTRRLVHFDEAGLELASWMLPDSRIPVVLAADPTGNIFVGSEDMIFQYAADGRLLTSWGDATVFTSISGIAVNSLGDVYVCDSGRKQIQMYGVRQPSDNPPVPPPPPPPPPTPPPPLTAHPAAVLLHIAPPNDHGNCGGPSRLDSVITAASVSPDDAHHSFVYLIATPNADIRQICGVQAGIAFDAQKSGHPGLEMLDWHLCADLEFPGDDWPGSGSGNTITWVDNYSTDVNIAGYFEVIAHGAATMSVIPWPITRVAKIANCAAVEYSLQIPVDRLGWVSWGHAGFGLDTDGCNPVLAPCVRTVPVEPSTWGRLKTLYGH